MPTVLLSCIACNIGSNEANLACSWRYPFQEYTLARYLWFKAIFVRQLGVQLGPPSLKRSALSVTISSRFKHSIWRQFLFSPVSSVRGPEGRWSFGLRVSGPFFVLLNATHASIASVVSQDGGQHRAAVGCVCVVCCHTEHARSAVHLDAFKSHPCQVYSVSNCYFTFCPALSHPSKIDKAIATVCHFDSGCSFWTSSIVHLHIVVSL